MTPALQEKIALVIVALAAFSVLFALFRSVLAEPLARLLLKRGQVKLAMKLKAQAKEPGCDHCKH